MASSSVELIEKFNRSVPENFIESVLKSLFNVYQTVYDYCDSNYSPEQRFYLLPHMRRAKFEDELREIAVNSKLKATTQINKAHNSHHIMISASTIALTSSYVETPFTMVRNAEFRKGYAKSNLDLFLSNNESADPNAIFYAILLHGDNGLKKNIPSFAYIQFPDKYCQSYIGSGIDLFSKYAHIVDTLIPKDMEENIEDKARPMLRDDIAKKEALDK